MTSNGIVPIVCQAKVTVTTVTSGQSACKGTLELTPGQLLFRGKPLFGKEEILSVPWDVVKELKINAAGNARMFSADFGGSKSNNRLSVAVLDGDWEAIQGFLKALPESTRQKKCPACGGPVRESVCASCGKNYRQTQMKQSLAAIAAGIVLTATGIFLATTSNDPGYAGMCVLGGIICAMGLLNIGRLSRQRQQ